eukprot:TRINITY_DN11829_c0_g1_i3.p1 TRINITY_DN11829_c0_g1~~TRINITY_DN11829_c0_g1_i3.p1  ORF type:complete len:518 (+),score=107.80 TRINITY_DN11829_c0_g1_i3:111-1664(+)
MEAAAAAVCCAEEPDDLDLLECGKQQQQLQLQRFAWLDGTARYEGELCGGVPHGCGAVMWPSGEMYAGKWARGRRHGRGRLVYADGSWYEGDFAADEQHGAGTRRYASGDLYKGEWQRGRQHGTGTLWRADGTVYVGEFACGAPHGRGTLRAAGAQGYTHAGAFAEGRCHGRGERLYADGSAQRGTWVQGKCSGLVSLAFSNGTVYAGSYRADYWHGTGVITYPELDGGLAFHGRFSTNVRTGYSEYRWANGNTLACFWSRGRPDPARPVAVAKQRMEEAAATVVMAAPWRVVRRGATNFYPLLHGVGIAVESTPERVPATFIVLYRDGEALRRVPCVVSGGCPSHGLKRFACGAFCGSGLCRTETTSFAVSLVRNLLQDPLPRGFSIAHAILFVRGAALALSFVAVVLTAAYGARRLTWDAASDTAVRGVMARVQLHEALRVEAQTLAVLVRVRVTNRVRPLLLLRSVGLVVHRHFDAGQRAVYVCSCALPGVVVVCCVRIRTRRGLRVTLAAARV